MGVRFNQLWYGEVLRYSTLRQQLRHEDEPLIAGIVLIVLPAAGGRGQHGVLLTEGYTVKFQPVLLCHLRKEVCQLLTCGVGSDIIKVNIRDEAGRDLEDHIIAFHREVDIRVLLHIVRIGIRDGVFLVQRKEQMPTEVALTEQLYADILVLVVGQRDLFRRLHSSQIVVWIKCGFSSPVQLNIFTLYPWIRSAASHPSTLARSSTIPACAFASSYCFCS